MKNHTLYRYDFGQDTFERAEIREYYEEDFGRYPTEEELDDYIDAIQRDSWDNLMTEIRYHEQAHGTRYYIVKAQIGTWRGVREGGKICTSMKEVIQKCCEDCDYITIFYKNNQFKIVGHHHDGTNEFTIRELTDDGCDYADRHEYDPDRILHNHLFNSSRWSKMVSMFPDIYGWG